MKYKTKLEFINGAKVRKAKDGSLLVIFQDCKKTWAIKLHQNYVTKIMASKPDLDNTEDLTA